MQVLRLGLAIVLVLPVLAGCVDGSTPTDEPVGTTGGASSPPDADGAASQANRTFRSTPVTNGTEDATPTQPVPVPSLPPLAFTAPVRVGAADDHGYEPSIAVGLDGLVYVTAHKKSTFNEGTRLASPIWYSDDQGATWKDLPSPASVHHAMYAFEGDIAIDGEGRVYFVDTYAADNTLSRWSPGPTWDWSRPVHGTAGVDDRPWLAAHGDGIVYYAGNNGAGIPAANNVVDDPGSRSRYWVYRSTDGGVTWSPGHGLAGSQWCHIAASPADDQAVAVACGEPDVFGDPAALVTSTLRSQIVVHRSSDQGVSWVRDVVAPLEMELAEDYPIVAYDADGHLVLGWVDQGTTDEASSKVMFARAAPGGVWQAFQAVAWNGTVERVWATAGAAGTAALAFYGTDDAEPDTASEWYPYALVTHEARAARPTWALARLADRPVAVGASSPGDFFEAAFGPDNALYVAFEFEDGTTLSDFVVSDDGDIVVVRQVSGANLTPPA